MISHKANIKPCFFVPGIFACVFLLSARVANAQFLDLRLEVEPKVTAQTLQQLNFGTLATNTGQQTVSLGDINMGIFGITALKNQVLLFNLQSPRQLHHDNPGVKDTIPVNIQMRYGNSLDNPGISEPLNGITTVQVADNNQAGPWNNIYLFIFGTVKIGNVEEGVYANQIVLHVEYL